MLAGTFNFVMAQRLVRKICDTCSHDVDMSKEKQYAFAKDALTKMDKNVLALELKKRNIDQIHWQNFLQ
jgi:type II secretory ATPase GspE/PulE/Tfp pilus assembly ATPase PilB-like protein